MLTRSCNSTRRHALEIMNNMIYLRDACFEFTTTEMPSHVRDLVSFWLDVSHHRSVSSATHIRVLHPFDFNDAFLSSLFPGEIMYYSTAFIGGVRFITSDHAVNKVIDGSNIIFKTGTEATFGRIRRLIRVNDGEPVFYVDVPKNLLDFPCANSGIVYHYSNIRTGVYTDEINSVFISSKRILEKCVFYERDDRVCTFSDFEIYRDPHKLPFSI